MPKILSKYISYLLKKGDQEFSLEMMLRYYFRALKFAKKCGLYGDYAPIYLSIATAYSVHEKYQQALIALALASRYPTDDLSYQLNTPLKLEILFQNDKLDEARELAICSLRDPANRIHETFQLLSEIYLALSHYPKAIIYGKKSLEAAWAQEYIQGVEIAYNNLLDIYRIMRDFDKAQKCLEEVEYIGLLQSSALLQFSQYNLLVTQKHYHQAKALLPQVESTMYELDPKHLHIFYGITLELFKQLQDKSSFDYYFNNFLTTNSSKDNYIEKWLAYAQAGDFYRQIGEYQGAIDFYQKMAYFLEQVRLSSLNLEPLDRVAFFRDKYHYLLVASLFLYEQKEYNLSLYFLESSKSTSLRDSLSYKSLAIKDTQAIKEYM
jgi:tetratricopeptide (TPR) repeat protein